MHVMVFLHDLARSIVELVRHHSLLTVFLLIAVEDCGIPLPLPGNAILLYLGYRVSIGRDALLPTLGWLSLATWTGSMVLYVVAFKVGRPVVSRYGRFVGLKTARIERIERWLASAGPVAVLVGRCLPGFRNPTSAISGTFGVALTVFALYGAIAAVAWTGGWLMLGAYVGRRVPLDATKLSFDHMVVGFTIFALLFLTLPTVGIVNAFRERRRERLAAQRANEATTDHPMGEAWEETDLTHDEPGGPAEGVRRERSR